MDIPFEERVKKTIINCAREYKSYLIDKKYILYSERFSNERFYIINAKEDNFLHLTGISTTLKAKDFYHKSLAGTLEVSDFKLGDKQQKGSIRRKISVLSTAIKMFSLGQPLLVEEGYSKNNIMCSFATSEGTCTIGFLFCKNAKPLTVLKGNVLKSPIAIELILDYRNKDDFDIIYNLKQLAIEDIKAILN